ncbi:MAG TPA: GMP/IMP nucleotidase [Gammaproteobacteria bacterium]|nr:GMP/IMP nucleotidase [Gammaproteobacteria bacterium]
MVNNTPIPFHNIDTVLLDMDGTLLDLHFDDHFWQEHVPQRYAEYNRLSLKAAKNILTPKFKEMEGTLEWYCVDFWSKELQMNIPELKAEVAHLIAIHDGVLHFLTALHQLQKKVYLVTNAHEKVLDLKMEKTQLHHQFDRLISSHSFGLPKEEPDFWHKLVETHFFEPDKTLFIDDSLAVLRSAQCFGIKYLYTIHKPSSHKPSRITTDFPMIHSFFEITPETNTHENRR